VWPKLSFLSLELIPQHQTQDDADDADHHRAEEGGPEAVHAQAEVEIIADPAGQHQHQRVDHQGEQSQRENDQRAGEELEQWAQERVQQTKDQCQPNQAQPGIRAFDAAFDGMVDAGHKPDGSEKPNPAVLEEKLGGSYVVSRTKVKAYPFCYGLHTMAQAFSALRVEHGIEHRAIRSARVGTNKRAVALHAEVAPKETMAAQYSMPFVAAVALVKDPKDPRLFGDDALNDPAICGLARKVELYADPEMQTHYPSRHGAHVTVHLDNGRILETTVLDAKGTPANPCSDDEIREKFRRLASVSHADGSVAEILSLVERIDTLPSIAPLSKALRAVSRT